ncbi:MAG: class I SAM-dependent methyltransferase [Halieaceae bacterium]|jgi:SAM-dependent methyltransferase|nr:class I SAM-dependent methyltransferase [Halieaceae bacterium]
MSFYDDVVLPHFINCACGSKPIMRQREKVVPLARGTVLELGIGTGLNLRYYDPERVQKVIGLDPSEASWDIARRNNPDTPFELEFIGLPGEQVPLPENSVDTVLVTYALCTIPDPAKALQCAKRVLRPGGQLVFCEHGQAPDASVQKWQDRINPLWRSIAGGCNLNRPIPRLLEAAGFNLTSLEERYLPKTPRFAGFNSWGVAEVA